MLACASLFAGCGGSDDDVGDTGRGAGGASGSVTVKPRYPYPARAVKTFVDACAATAAQRRACTCTIDRLQRTLPYEDFQAADRAIRAGRPEPREVRRVFDVATDACRTAG